MQVKSAVGKAIFHKLPIYNEVLVLSPLIILLDLLFVFQFFYTTLIPRYYVLPVL